MKDKKRKTKKKNKKTLAHDKFVNVIKAVCIILVVLVLLFVAADRFGNITFSSVGDYFGTLVSGAKSGEGYPYYFESSSAESVKKINSDLFVLTDSTTFVLDSTAKKFGETQHSYSQPLVLTSNGRAVMCDVGGTSYCVFSKTKKLYDSNADQKIITASIGKDGSVAIATRGDNSMSELTVYNKNRKEVFKWECAKENIIAVDVSDNGNKAVVSVVGAENGELYYKVIIFDFRYSEKISEYSFGSKSVSAVNFIGSNKILVTGKEVFSVIGKKDKYDEDLSLNTLSRVYTSDNNITVAVFSKYGSSTSKIIKVYSATAKELFTVELDSGVRSVSCDSGYVSVLTDRQLLNYTVRGKQVGTYNISSDGVSCFSDGGNTYVLTTSSVVAYKTVGSNLSNAEETTLLQE